MLKPLLPRRRPAASELPAYQTIANPPRSSSFPSGHSASAAAFATAVAMESPRTALAVVPLAAAVAYSRIHVGVHWTSDVVVGAAVGTGVALATERWWPVREQDEARARPLDTVPELPEGKGLVIVSNQRSGDPEHDPADELEAALPQAVVVRADPDRALDDQLDEAIEHAGDEALAVGVAGGDGTVAAAAAVAGRRGLPLVVVPTGTLNHFARDVGVYDLQEAVDATGTGQAVAVDLALVDVHPGRGDRPRVARGDAPAGLPQHREHRLVPRPRAAARAVDAAVGQVARVRRGARGRAAARRARAGQDRGPVGRGVVPLRRQRPLRARAGWCPRGGRRWTPGCWTCAGCAPTCASPGCAPSWACSQARWGTAGCTASGRSRSSTWSWPCRGCSPPTVKWSRRRAATRSGWPPRPIPVYRRDERQWTGRERPYQRV